MNPLVSIGSSIAGACAGVVAYAATHPRAQLFGETLRHTNSPRKLAITFDDGPNPSVTPRLLDLLAKYKAHATFFLIGKYVRECPDLVQETIARGHVIANHTETHPNLFWCTPSAIRDELRRCHEAIAAATNSTPKWFRPPFGFRNPWVVKAASELSMRTVMWTLLPGDWKLRPTETLIHNFQPIANNAQQNLSLPKSVTGDILCLHDGGHRALNADRTRTLKALEHWLPRWRDAGLEFVTIEEAVSNPAA
jgi:peptidoglycan-N-acetylglucosamine deacetylase